MSTVPPVPQWTHDLSKMTQNDFQSICKLVLPNAVASEGKPTSEGVDKSGFLKSPVMKREDEFSSPPKTLGRFVHFLRCSICGLESINKTRFDSHLPCSQRGNADHRYYLHTCSACFACSTSRNLMDEHIDLFHKGTQSSSPLRFASPLISPPHTCASFARIVERGEERREQEEEEEAEACHFSPFPSLLLHPPKKNSIYAPYLPEQRFLKSVLKTVLAATVCVQVHNLSERKEYACFGITARQAELIRTQEVLHPAALTTSTSPSVLSSTLVATTTSGSSPLCRRPNRPFEFASDGFKRSDDNGCLDLRTSATAITTMTAAAAAAAACTVAGEEQTRSGVEYLKKCHICGADLAGSVDALTRHLTFVHLIPMPLMLGGGWDIPSLMAVSNSLGQNSPSERLPQLSFPFGQFDTMPQQTPPPLPLGSKTFFGLNFDLPPLSLLDQNGEAGPRHLSTSEPEFKRARIDHPLGESIYI
ncbi:unnamed protein product [Hydatigera taeniaeformis]|uniref:C2H2-type domain-containing protein n=1 Tax=Hydatigena taeniaeformis TaxID=6205 RepID=A0A0R3X5C1_HYDTA|nr:unnamed protein product [Hydatigera taeniaeformis]